MSPYVCHHCGAAVMYDDPIPRESECDRCRSDLRACRNCRHHAPGLHNACRETEADVVVDKTRRNFCEFFVFTREPFSGAPGAMDRVANARSKLDALFGAGGQAGSASDRTSAAEARAKLDALFRPQPEAKREGDKQ